MLAEIPDKNDYNVRMIGIWLDEATNTARVSFIGGAATSTATGIPANELVTFQDKNRDDATKWWSTRSP